MAPADKGIFFVGRLIGWIGFLFIAVACWHSNAWASALASVVGSTIAFIPAGRYWFRYTLKSKIALLLLSLILSVLLFSGGTDQQENDRFDSSYTPNSTGRFLAANLSS
jgi:hypothetical protein